MSKIEIKHRLTGAVIFEHAEDNNTTKKTVEAAVKAGANLRGANLQEANLQEADLQDANIQEANLRRANLRGANLRGANLRGADLRGADLWGADLWGADLWGADLDGETLTKTPVTVSNLKWWVLITDGFMRIGCQRHSHADWESFDDAAIKEMEYGAFEFWTTWKEPLIAMCKAHTKE